MLAIAVKTKGRLLRFVSASVRPGAPPNSISISISASAKYVRIAAAQFFFSFVFPNANGNATRIHP